MDTLRTVCSGYFDVKQGDNQGSKASAYIPMDFLGRALIRCLQAPKQDNLIELNGKKLAMPKNVILTRAANNNPEIVNAKRSVWVGTVCSPTVPINESALAAFKEQTNVPKHQLAALRLLKASRNQLCNGSIPVQYEQKNTGRLVEVLSSIQNTPREVISAALDGCWDYDISNAHFSILKEWANGLGKETPVIDRYIQEKKQIRQSLADQCKANEADIKECLISLMYGAALSSHEKHASIGRLLKRQSASLFNKHPFVISLSKEIRKLRGFIVDDMPKRMGLFGNAMNIYEPPNGKKNAKSVLLCHALQGVEALALKTVLDAYGTKILLPMHDGWVSNERLDCNELQRLIKQTTGYDLEVEEKRLPKYPPQWDSKAGETVEAESSLKGEEKAAKFNANFEAMFAKPILVKPGSLIVSTGPEWNEPEAVHSRKRRKAPATPEHEADDY